MLPFTALVTLLATIFYFYLGLRVGAARGKFGVKAPATTGHPDFERAFRVQMNTLEWMPIFLPALWLFAAYLSDVGAAIIGLVWILGRFLYLTGYSEAAGKRGRGFGIQALSCGILWIGALSGIILPLAHGASGSGRSLNRGRAHGRIKIAFAAIRFGRSRCQPSRRVAILPPCFAKRTRRIGTVRWPERRNFTARCSTASPTISMHSTSSAFCFA